MRWEELVVADTSLPQLARGRELIGGCRLFRDGSPRGPRGTVVRDSTAMAAGSESEARSDYERRVAPLRPELLAHAYRMLGSYADAQDVTQDALLRGWRAYDRFEPSGSFKAWLYRIATNVCLTRLSQRRPRMLSWSEEGPASPGRTPVPAPLPPERWIEPFPSATDIESRVAATQEIALTFVSLLQRLTPQQRAALLLRDVAGFSAKEAAAVLETTEVSVNSALVRARGAAAALRGDAAGAGEVSPALWSQAQQYMKATATSDLKLLAALLSDAIRLSMPPHPIWFQGRDEVFAFFEHTLGETFARGGYRMHPTVCNGMPAFGLYESSAEKPNGPFRACALQVLEVAGDRVNTIHCFMTPGFVTQAGLPEHWAAGDARGLAGCRFPSAPENRI
ncbi:MAG: RNA polymerase subunit sigma-70 [Myxococcota bacterium]